MNNQNMSAKGGSASGGQKITPSLWFDLNCEEAANYYVSVFNGAPGSKNDSKIISSSRYPDKALDEHMKGFEGKVLTMVFDLAGQRFMALNGGPIFKFNESVSFTVDCQDQAEVDYFWEKLSAVPASEQCGWCKDKFGLSWQIVPKRLPELLGDKDPGRAQRAMQAMLKMKKIIVADLESAADQK